jgi:peroxiredoxin
MNRTIPAILLMICTALAPAAEVPRKAPDFAVQTAPDKYIWLNQYAGKTVIVAFILTTCPHCQFTTGLLNKIQKDYADKGVAVIESAIDPMSSLRIPEFVKSLGITFPVGYNEQSYAAKFLGAGDNDPMMMPQLVFVDRKGMIQVQLPGDDVSMARGIQEATLRSSLEKVMKEGQADVRPPARKKLQ